MSSLPQEVLADVLSRLPVKSLLRFRCVSKFWLALINSSDIVKLHLDRSVQTKANLSLIVRDLHLHKVDFDSLEDGIPQASELDHHPLRCQDYGTEIWGSCNGLLCLSNDLDTVVLWNPSTRDSRKLPYAAIEVANLRSLRKSRVYGFGYDRTTEDYKVVRIVVLRDAQGDSFDYEVKVYSLKSDSWHRAEKFPNYPNLKRTRGALVGDAMHWVVAVESESQMAGLVVAFDLGSEKYRLVPQPEYSDMNFFMNVECFGGCLSLICNYYMVHVDIWVMKDYGVKESWTKLISVTQTDAIKPFQLVRPVAYSNSGQKVLLELDCLGLIWYDLKQGSFKNVRIHGLQDILQVETCLESLVPVDAEAGTDVKRLEEEASNNLDNFLSKGFKLVL